MDMEDDFDFESGIEVDMVCPQCNMTFTFLDHEIGQFVVCDCCWDSPILITQAEFERIGQENETN